MGTVFPDVCGRGNVLYYTAKQFEEQRNQSVDGLQISQNSVRLSSCMKQGQKRNLEDYNDLLIMS